jgi:sodium transport system permease protein
MNPRIIFTIYQKEMLELTRDRRTLISMIALPLAAIPVLFIVTSHFVSSREKTAETEAAKIAVSANVKTAGLLDQLSGWGFEPVSKPDLRGAVERKEVAAAIEETVSESGDPELRLYEDQTNDASAVASTNLRVALDALKTDKVRAALAGSGISEKILTPFRVRRVNVAPPKKMAGFLFGSIIGYTVILLMFSCCMYPSIDMTAGEKERRTLEVLLSSPARREEIVLGKIMAATTAAFITAMLTVGSMVVSFRMMPHTAKASEMFKAGVPMTPSIVALVLVSLLPTAVVAAAVMISICSFAKSFKEGQSYLTPLIMLVVFPAVVGMLPGVELKGLMAMIPVFNVSQLIKQIFLGEFSVRSFLVAFLANLAYATFAFWTAVRVFKSEGVLFRV